MGIFDFRDPVKRKKKELRIVCDLEGVKINNKPVDFPTTYAELSEIFGEASRIVPFKETGIKVYLWDELGIYCSMPDPNKVLMLMLIFDNRYDLGHQPKSNFKSELMIDNVKVIDELPIINPERPYIIRPLYREEKLVAIGLGWNSRNPMA